MAKNTTFAEKLNRFAELSDGKPMCDTTAQQFEHLRSKVIREDLILYFLTGLALARSILCKPVCPEGSEGYGDLLVTLFFNDRFEPDERYVKMIWLDHLRKIRVGEADASRSYGALCTTLGETFITEWRGEIAQTLDAEALRKIDQALVSLTTSQGFVLYAKYGIGRPKLTPTEVKDSLGVTHNRVWQLEAAALTQLRKRLNDFGFHLPLHTALKQARGKIVTLESIEFTAPSLQLLLKRTEDLELSIRSTNCLGNASIIFLGDLIQRSEATMLRTKNFGRKGLMETKAALACVGLTYGMRLDPQLLEAFNKERAQLLAK